jgi:hypothetical protein
MRLAGTYRPCVVLVLPLMLTVLAAGEPEGPGTLVARTIDAALDRIDVGDGITVDLTVGSAAWPAVLVTYDDDLIDRITTRVRDSTVIIEVDGSSLGSTGPRASGEHCHVGARGD